MPSILTGLQDYAVGKKTKNKKTPRFKETMGGKMKISDRVL